jgi:hypothetical protein
LNQTDAAVRGLPQTEVNIARGKIVHRTNMRCTLPHMPADPAKPKNLMLPYAKD